VTHDARILLDEKQMKNADAQTMALEIHGRVQGVGYRWFARDAASKLGLRGFVKNLPSGAVELVAQGPRAALDALLAECKRGPAGGRVDDISVSWLETTSTYAGFEIQR